MAEIERVSCGEADPQAARQALEACDVPLVVIGEAVRRCLPARGWFRYDGASEALGFVSAEGDVVPLSALPDGERELVVLVAELAWRAVMLNPQHGLDALERAEGVALIDDVALRLPDGQKHRALEGLRAAFPNLQLIITARSQAVVPAGFLDDEVALIHLGRP